MYRRTLAAYWSAQPGELKADECIEDIFAGGDGWGDREKPYLPKRSARFAGDDSSGSMSGGELRSILQSGGRRGGSGSRINEGMHRTSHETLRPGNKASRSPNGRGELGSLEQQTRQMKVEAERNRRRPHHEVDEFDMREDLRNWRRIS